MITGIMDSEVWPSRTLPLGADETSAVVFRVAHVWFGVSHASVVKLRYNDERSPVTCSGSVD